MTESTDGTAEILRRLENIEHQVTSLDETSAFAMRSSREEHIAELDKIFGKSKRRAQVYLAADGRRTVGQIADHRSMKGQNVSTDLTKLGDEGLLQWRTQGANTYWRKKAIDRTLRISKHLMDCFGLDPDGTPA